MQSVQEVATKALGGIRRVEGELECQQFQSRDYTRPRPLEPRGNPGIAGAAAAVREVVGFQCVPAIQSSSVRLPCQAPMTV
jgi:hypothetical protein